MKYKTVIIGVGVMGAATAYYLSHTQKGILALDQYEVDNNLNSSQDYSRVFRYAYGTDEYYSRLAVHALELWKEVELASATQLYFQSGCLLLGNSGGSYASTSYATMKKIGLDIEMLEDEEMKTRFPQFSCNAGVLDPNGGVIEASQATLAFIRLARANGVQVRTKAKVVDIQDGLVVLADGEKIHADMIVVTGGSWNAKLLRGRVKIKPTRQEEVYFQPGGLKDFQKDVFPAFGHMESGFYGTPVHKINGVKLANHFPGAVVDPDTVSRDTTDQFVEQCRAFFKEYIPGLVDAKVLEAKVCLYDMTSDEDFIIDKLTDKIVVGAGFSGHGFKFAPLIGKILSELATNRPVSYDISRFSLHKT